MKKKEGSKKALVNSIIPGEEPGKNRKKMLDSDEVLATLQSLTTEAAIRKIEKQKLEKLVIQRTEELERANHELFFQNGEKEKRATELIIANKELAFQNKEKEKRAAELIIANKELVFQNKEKAKRASELVIVNKELAFQNKEKERNAIELIAANKELRVFTFISSHDMQEPLRKIQMFASMVLEKERSNLSADAKNLLKRAQAEAWRMQTLIEALQVYSHSNLSEQIFEKINLADILEEVKLNLAEIIIVKNAVINSAHLGEACVNLFQFRQVINHLLDNALKFSRAGISPVITIQSSINKPGQLQNEQPVLPAGSFSPGKEYCHIVFLDNGIGFDPQYKDKIFEVFQRLHPKEDYTGTGIGLPIVKKIVETHNGFITASGEPGKGARFDIYIPMQ